MNNYLQYFENITRKSNLFSNSVSIPTGGLHPFDERNIHPKLPRIVIDLFDDGFYSQATYEAVKFLDKEVQHLSGTQLSGVKLMQQVFGDNPIIKLTNLDSVTEKDEQKGYQFLFTGAMYAVRNPRGHEVSLKDTPDKCLDHLSLVSLLLRRLEEAGYNIS